MAEPVKKRITTFGQVIFIVFALVVDLVQVILDIFLVGLIANRIIDIVVGLIFLLYAMLKGLTFDEDWKVYGSIVGTILGDFIPGFDVAPFFVLDAWYITHSIKKKDKARQQAADEAAQAVVADQERKDWIANYQAQQAEEEREESEQVGNEQAREAAQEAPQQRLSRQSDNGGVGRIAPFRPQTATYPQPAKKPASNGDIIK